MMRGIYHTINKLSPTLGSFIRESYYTLNGWRFRELISRLERSPTSMHSLGALSIEWSLAQTTVPADEEGGPIAFVSCLPPDDTGIATCSLYSWLDTDQAVDIFSPVTDVDWFFGLQRLLKKESNGRARLLDVSAFLASDMIQSYRKIIIAVGNSDHHTYIFPLLKKISTFGPLDRVLLYIHDPCVLNLVMKGTESSPSQFVRALEDIYGRTFALDALAQEDAWRLHKALFDHGVMGLRYFYRAGINKFIVNSAAAKRIVSADVPFSDVSIMQIFHPVFLPLNSGNGLSGIGRCVDGLCVGTFGAPGSDKLTDLVIDAVSILADRGVEARLIIAGYGVNDYTVAHADRLKNIPHTSFNGPTDWQLVELFKQVDVAVQLRKSNRGESSGILSQLLMLEKSVIVSAVGSFTEYGNAVRCVEPNLTANDLADVILMVVEEPIPTKECESFASLRSPKEWRKRLRELLEV